MNGFVLGSFRVAESSLAFPLRRKYEQSESDANVDRKRGPRQTERNTVVQIGIGRKAPRQVRLGVLQRITEYFDADQNTATWWKTHI